MADWHGTKGMRVDKMLVSHVVTFNVHLHDLDLGFSKSNCWISGMGWLIDMEWKECESIGCYTHFVTFNFDLKHDIDLGFARSNFEKVVSQEWDGRLTWNQRDVGRWNVRLMLWLSTVLSPMTLTLDFQGQILKKSYLMNGMADWHGTKGMWVDRMLDPWYDFQCSPLPWPWPWIFKVKIWKRCFSGMGLQIDVEWTGCELIECETYIVISNFDLTHELDPGIGRSNIEIAVTQAWKLRLTWNERGVSWIWCLMHNGIDLGPQCMANRSAK